MYLPAIFEDVDPDSIARTIDSIGLTQLVIYRLEGLTATPVPLLRRSAPINSEQWTLVGHLRNGNPCLVELHPTKITAKRKFSQNQPEVNRSVVREAFSSGTPSQQAMSQKMASDTLR